MEPDKFEKNIKEKLDKRRLAPSDEAWEKISGQIESSKKQGGKTYFWIGIAASLIVIIGLSLFFFNSGNKMEELDSNKVVEIERPTLEDQNSMEESTEEGKKQISNAVVEGNKTEMIVKNSSMESKEKPVENIISDSNTLVANEFKVSTTNNELNPVLSNEVLDSKIAEVIAKVDAIEVYGEVSDAEVDSLLLNAQKEILNQKLFNRDKTVNAMALLTEVEEELDQSFRDQIFETLKTGFLKVRTAVADRNN